jgi:TRAP-type C4-dicarboxylate transport system permease small subunit
MRFARLRLAALRTLLDRTIGVTVAAASILVLPLSALLFLQWPLRDLWHAYSREANDLAQILFALYVGVAITAATRARAHLAADGAAVRLPEWMRRALTRWAAPAVVVVWALFLIYASFSSLAQSVRQLEAFPETYNPGYFVIRIALVVLALLALLQALAGALSSGDRDGA